MTHAAKEEVDPMLPEATFAQARPSQRTRSAIRGAVIADKRSIPARSLELRLLHLLAAAIACATLVVASYGPIGLGGLSQHLLATLVCAVSATLATVAIGSYFTPRLHNVLGRSNRWLFVTAVVIAWSLYMLASVSEHAIESAVSSHAIGCGIRSISLGAVGGAAFMWVWRRSDPWTPRLSGALIGACAGVIACAGVGIACPASEGGHLLVGHWLAVPLLAIVGALAARRVLSP